MKDLPSIARVRELFSYDPVTGRLTRVGKSRTLNNAGRGKLAGSLQSNGYRRVGVDDVHISEHRVIWALVYGEWPASPIDHINRVRDDNRTENLRLANRSLNGANMTVGRRGVCEYRGVKRAPQKSRADRWSAMICVGMKQIYLGAYNTPELAARIYDYAAYWHFGEFADLNFPREPVVVK